MNIDYSKIKTGDKVRVNYGGLTGWQTAVLMSGDLRTEEVGLRLQEPSVIILEHEPAPVVIEVELPTPAHWDKHTFLPAVHRCCNQHLQFSGNAVQRDTAEDFALAILSLVREAKALKR